MLKRMSTFTTLALLLGCSKAMLPGGSHVSQFIDDSSTEFVMIYEDNNPIPVLKVTQSDGKQLGYRTNCGSNVGALATAFGYDGIEIGLLREIDPERDRDEYNQLRLDEQPILDCSAPKARVFAVIQKSPEQSHYADYYLQFPDRQGELYAAGCQGMLNFMGDSPANYIPVTAASLIDLVQGNPALPKTDDKEPKKLPDTLKELRCFANQGRPAPASTAPLNYANRALKGGSGTKLYIHQNNNEFSNIRASKFPVIVSNAAAFAVDCGSNYSSLFDAIGFKGVKASDLPSLVQEGQSFLPEKRLPIKCKDASISRAFRVINDTSNSLYVKFSNQNDTLVRLGCSALSNYYGLDRVPEASFTKVTFESLKYLTTTRHDSSLVDLSCNGVSHDQLALIYQQIFGVPVTSGSVDAGYQMLLENSLQMSALPEITSFLVERLARNQREVQNILVARAFPKVFARAPSESESRILSEWILASETKFGRTLRAHHDEIVEFLKQIRFQSPDTLAGACSATDGAACDTETLDRWTIYALANPNVSYGYDVLINDLVIANEKSDPRIQAISERVFQVLYSRSSTEAEDYQLIAIIREKNLVRAHFSEISDHLYSHPLPFDFGLVRSVANSSLLDVTGPTLDNGAALQMWTDAGDGQTNQRFNLQAVGNAPGYYWLLAKNSNKCLDINGWNGPSVLGVNQWDCYAATEGNQMWKIVRSGQGFLIHSAWNESLCLAPPMSYNRGLNRTPITLLACDANDRFQLWTFESRR